MGAPKPTCPLLNEVMSIPALSMSCVVPPVVVVMMVLTANVLIWDVAVTQNLAVLQMRSTDVPGETWYTLFAPSESMESDAAGNRRATKVPAFTYLMVLPGFDAGSVLAVFPNELVLMTT